eukprot:1073499-Pelagomonas_calceolata.AAC.2
MGARNGAQCLLSGDEDTGAKREAECLSACGVVMTALEHNVEHSAYCVETQAGFAALLEAASLQRVMAVCANPVCVRANHLRDLHVI